MMKNTNTNVIPYNTINNELYGQLKEYLNNGAPDALITVDVSFFRTDSTYQTKERTERPVNYLTDNWDPHKCAAITAVYHKEEQALYVIDGYGRLKASQIVDPVKYKEMRCYVILDAPDDPKERRKFEAELYAFQNRDVAKVTPVQKHGAFVIINKKGALIIEKMKKKYNFEISNKKGKRGANVLGSYAECYKIAEQIGEDGVDWIFKILKKARWNETINGYNKHIIRALKDMYLLYPNNRNEIGKFLGKALRKVEWDKYRSYAVTAYPERYMTASISLYTEDLVVQNLGYDKVRDNKGKIISVKKTA